MDLFVVSRETSFHGLRYCLMKGLIPIDLIVALWVISASIDLVVVLMEDFLVSIDLIAVL